MRHPVPRSRRPAAALLLAGLLALPPAAARAAAADPVATAEAGTWDIAFEQANRRCRLNLTRDSAGDGYSIAMPAGCRRAFPLLSGVASWSPGEGGHVLFRTEAGQAALDFGPASGSPFLQAVAGEGDLYTLTPTDAARLAAITAAQAAAAPPLAAAVSPAAAAAKPAAPPRPMTVGQVAGHYAVVRLRKDTGCMVTLDDDAKGPKGSLKAHLAPACGDQGIVVFDPVGWLLAHGELVLMARKGHTTELMPQDDGTWANAPAGGRVLTLKRL